MPAFCQVFKGGYVGLAKVGDMDVVADTGAIRRAQFVAEDAQRRCDPQRSPESEGNQMRLRVMELTDASPGMSTGSIEVTQRNRA